MNYFFMLSVYVANPILMLAIYITQTEHILIDVYIQYTSIQCTKNYQNKKNQKKNHKLIHKNLFILSNSFIILTTQKYNTNCIMHLS
jgi:hypothetical protein